MLLPIRMVLLMRTPMLIKLPAGDETQVDDDDVDAGRCDYGE